MVTPELTQTALPEPTSPAGEASVPQYEPATDVRTFVILPEQSAASYEVQEIFFGQNFPVKAVGKTTTIEGEFAVSLDGKPAAQVTRISVDLRNLTSDDARRDRRIRSSWLESDRYPLAEFVSTGIQGAPDSYAEGEEVAFQLLGDLTIREITRPVTFDVTAKLEGDTVTGTATSYILMKDFGFDPPDIANVLTVEDGVTVIVNFTAKEQ
jgi:polyisoprenoid-binding protein YceI